MLNAIKSKLTQLYCKAATDLYYAKNSDQGDTNFISIIIVLAIVIIVAGVFVGFKDQILEAAEEAINDFTKLFGSDSDSGSVGISIHLFV